MAFRPGGGLNRGPGGGLNRGPACGGRKTLARVHTHTLSAAAMQLGRCIYDTAYMRRGRSAGLHAVLSSSSAAVAAGPVVERRRSVSARRWRLLSGGGGQTNARERKREKENK
uniref:Uncharacterized protein n=1 Tax=Sipha flava TaxID=143950 RepID=A0A2S2PYL0_9HEMI